MDGKDELRIVLLGRTGVGKSSAGNTILGEKVFETECSLQSKTHICKRYEKEINGKRIVVIDTPGLFDTDRSEKELKKEIISCLIECAPGPHVFIVVLEVGRYTEENQKAVEKLIKYFTSKVFPHMVILFTHGNDLGQNMRIHKFIKHLDVEGNTSRKQPLKDFAEKCGNRVFVIDSEHWDKDSRVSAVIAELKKLNISEEILQEIKNRQLNERDETPWLSILSDQADSEEAEGQYESEEQEMREYRSNQFQLTQLMKSIDNITKINKEPYRNKALEAIGEAIKEEIDKIIQEMKDEGKIRDVTEVDMVVIRRRAIERVRTKLERPLAGVATGILLGALLGAGVGVAAPVVLVAGLIRAGYRKATRQRPQAGAAPVERANVRAGIAAAGVGVGVGAGVEILGATMAEAAVLGAGVGTGIGAAVGAGVCLLYGARKGAMSGYAASKTSDNPNQTANKVVQALRDDAKDVLKACWNLEKPDAGDEAEEPLVQNN
ncbi:GTPase IMAP family member 9-like [Colossoma macropomum]|uniref:GTPase IMAP family member 9-like n=1 Tax=Colossoma macropomum TaxID=42526 RepID=UPI0018655D84|nr:GTPase IMAP family member 9-like [Colossoma macropomum]